MKKRYNLTKSQIIQYFNDGKDVNQIANIYGCHISSIHQFCKKNNIILKNSLHKQNLIGKKWHDLEVISKTISKNKQQQWICKCKCGNTVILSTATINSGKQKSCGCYFISHKDKSTNWNGYEKIHGKCWSSIKKGAESRNIPFEITIEYAWNLFLKQNKKCALSGVPIDFADTIKQKEHGQQTASLDRIDSSKGYTEENIQWIHKDINKMKMNLSEPIFIEWCNKISDYAKTRL